jgi:cation diffusion facilitator family transporter
VRDSDIFCCRSIPHALARAEKEFVYLTGKGVVRWEEKQERAEEFMETGRDAERLRLFYGKASSAAGIAINAMLFAIKCWLGLASGASSVVADAFNNLSDAASSAITLIGFRISSQGPDKEHPFGHGRAEYISALTVSLLILLMGGQLLIDSAKRLFAPSYVEMDLRGYIILAIAAASKLAMMAYNRVLGKKYESQALLAASTDSFCDFCATLGVMASLAASWLWNVRLDAPVALAVSAYILYAGIKSTAESVSPLLGKAPDKAFVAKVQVIAARYPNIIGMHDLIAHEYGHGRLMISFHAEVSSKSDLLSIHDTIDTLENEISSSLGCLCVIHLDPVETDNEEVAKVKSWVARRLADWDERISIHDFRMVPGPTHTNLVFDMVIPFEIKLSKEELKRKAEAAINEGAEGRRYRLVISVDRSYV